MKLPQVPGLGVISERLPLIFPEGLEHRPYLIREMAARTIYVLLYAGAVEGSDRWARPSHVYFMTGEQALKTAEAEREEWYLASSKPSFRPTGARWYADNTREPIRDETIRAGLVPTGAVVERPGVPVTSSKPRYALDREFAGLFGDDVTGERLAKAISAWQRKHLSKAALSRTALLKRVEKAAGGAVLVRFPNDETRALSPGLSSVITKAVVEEFAPRFLSRPAVLWISESGNKVVARDEGLAVALGLTIDPSKNLPDVILVDLGRQSSASDMLVVFTEVVATDGAITQQRFEALRQIAVGAGFRAEHIAFLTAFASRASPAFRKSAPELAWGSFAWCLSDPDHLIHFRGGKPRSLSKLR